MITYKLESLPVAMMRKAGLSKQTLLGDGRPVNIACASGAQWHAARSATCCT